MIALRLGLFPPCFGPSFHDGGRLTRVPRMAVFHAMSHTNRPVTIPSTRTKSIVSYSQFLMIIVLDFSKHRNHTSLTSEEFDQVR